MNNELNHIGNGVVLFVFCALTASIFAFAGSIKPSPADPSESPVTKTELAQVNVKGKQQFLANCASCHSVNKNLTGPALAGIEERVTDRQVLIAWVKNSQQVLRSGNKYFNDLYLQYQKTPMNSFTHLNDEDIENILEYIRQSEPGNFIQKEQS